MIRVETHYHENGIHGSGFYNHYISERDGEWLEGPYASRPLAKIVATKKLLILNDNKVPA